MYKWCRPLHSISSVLLLLYFFSIPRLHPYYPSMHAASETSDSPATAGLGDHCLSCTRFRSAGPSNGGKPPNGNSAELLLPTQKLSSVVSSLKMRTASLSMRRSAATRWLGVRLGRLKTASLASYLRGSGRPLAGARMGFMDAGLSLYICMYMYILIHNVSIQLSNPLWVLANFRQRMYRS